MLFLLLACTNEPAAPTKPTAAPAATQPALTPIRVGWQTTWATQGQLAVILQKTNILTELGFAPEFIGFSYGGPLNEGALAGQVDVLFTADQPALVLASKDPRWGAIGRLMYNRVGTFVPPDSPIQSMAMLKGARVAVPFGAAAQRELLFAARDAGLDPKVDLTAINLGIEELVALAGAGSQGGRWGDIDAGAAWDPAFANLEHTGKARAIAERTVLALVMMSDTFQAAHPGAEQRFMQAIYAAWGWFQAHPTEANAAFLKAAKLNMDAAVLEKAAAVEPNLKGPISVDLSEAEVAKLKVAADFMLQAGMLSPAYDVATLLRPEATVSTTAPANMTVVWKE